MGRKKIQIKKIEDQKLKTITFTRRRNGLLKKAYELSVLCDTRVCVLMFDPKDMCHVYSSVKDDKDGEAMMSKFISKSFTTVDPRRKYDTSPDLQLDEHAAPWRVQTAENNVAMVNTYTVQPNSTTPATPGPDAGSPGDDDDDGDGLDQLSVKFTRSYHVNKSPKKSPKKGSVQGQQGHTPPASTTFSPPAPQGQFFSPHEGYAEPFDYSQGTTYEGLGIANGLTPQLAYAMTPVPQYVTAPAVLSPQQYLRSPVPVMQQVGGQPLQQLHLNPHIQRSPGRIVQRGQMLPVSPMPAQMPYQGNSSVPTTPRLRTQTQPLPGHSPYDQNALMQAAFMAQMRQQQQWQQQQFQQQQAYAAQHPMSPQRMPTKPVSRSLPSSPEKRRMINQLPQVAELDVLAIPTPLVSSPLQTKHHKADAKADSQQHLAPPAEEQKTHLRGISYLDEIFGVPSDTAESTSKGPIAPDGTLRDDEEEDEFDTASLEADVNAWLTSENLPDGTNWLDQVVLN